MLQASAATLVTLQRDRFLAALPKGHALAAREPLSEIPAALRFIELTNTFAAAWPSSANRGR